MTSAGSYRGRHCRRPGAAGEDMLIGSYNPPGCMLCRVNRA